jgi:hypothetical protein
LIKTRGSDLIQTSALLTFAPQGGWLYLSRAVVDPIDVTSAA